jgi:hypothetical protein
MSRLAYIGLALIVSLPVITGCATSTHSSVPVSNIRPDGARLTEAQAIRIAKQEAESEGIHLTDYKEPDASFEIHYGFRSQFTDWRVGFESKIPFPGGHFTIFVDDQKQTAKLAF